MILGMEPETLENSFQLSHKNLLATIFSPLLSKGP